MPFMSATSGAHTRKSSAWVPTGSLGSASPTKVQGPSGVAASHSGTLPNHCLVVYIRYRWVAGSQTTAGSGWETMGSTMVAGATELAGTGWAWARLGTRGNAAVAAAPGPGADRAIARPKAKTAPTARTTRAQRSRCRVLVSLGWSVPIRSPDRQAIPRPLVLRDPTNRAQQLAASAQGTRHPPRRSRGLVPRTPGAPDDEETAHDSQKGQHFGDHRAGSRLEEESQQNQASRQTRTHVRPVWRYRGNRSTRQRSSGPVVGGCVAGTLRAECVMALNRMWAQGSVCPGNPGGCWALASAGSGSGREWAPA